MDDAISLQFVLDNGSDMGKASFMGDNAPWAKFFSIMDCPRCLGMMVRLLPGQLAPEQEKNPHLKYPIYHSIVTN